MVLLLRFMVILCHMPGIDAQHLGTCMRIEGLQRPQEFPDLVFGGDNAQIKSQPYLVIRQIVF